MNSQFEEEMDLLLKQNRDRLKQLRGEIEAQNRAFDNQIASLHEKFLKHPQTFTNLFWEKYNNWLNLSINERRKSPRYCDELFWAITKEVSFNATKLACEILGKKDSLLKTDAIEYLHNAMDPTSVPALINLLYSEDYDIASKAALALGELGDTRAESHLIQIVDKYNTESAYSKDRLDDTYPIIRSSAFDALRFLRTDNATKKVYESLYHDFDVEIQLKAIRHLVEQRPDNLSQVLINLSENKNSQVSNLARSFLGN